MAEEQLQEADVRIKYFGATWGGPCKTFKPVIKKLEKAGYPIQIYDIDEDPVLAESYRIMSVPTLKIEVDGKVEETMVGIQDPDTLLGKFHIYYPKIISEMTQAPSEEPDESK